MAYDKIGICNIALSMTGADSIRDFDEKNKRARLCDRFYDIVKDYLLSKFDWPFARSFKQLQQLDDLSEDEQQAGMYAFQLPSDCMTPRSIWPRGSRDNWEIIGNVLYTIQSTCGLYYTKQNVDVTKYSDTFIMLLSTGLAVRLSPPISQDPALTKALQAQYLSDQAECWESDANIGNDYRAYDEDPNHDTFVNPEEALDQYNSIPRVIT